VNHAAGVIAAPRAGMLHAFEAYGLELEYMIVSRRTLDVQPLADDALTLAGGVPGSGEACRGALGWSNELASHVVELKNVAPAPLDGLATRYQREIAALDALLAARDARLMPGGMHPWMDPRSETRLWPHAHADVYRAYDRIFDCRAHGWGNVQSTHVNLPFADDRELERLHAAVRVALPIAPAIAASSPYVEGRRAAALDQRMRVYASHAQAVPSLTGHIVPETVRSRAQYERDVLQPMYADIAVHDPGGVLRHEWLNARGAIVRFSRNAIELRVMDVQECPAADVALAALLIDLVRALYEERWSSLAAQQSVPLAALTAALDACVARAQRARLDHREYLRLFGMHAAQCEARALWEHIAQALDTAHATHGELWRKVAAHVLAHGTLAQRLIDAAGDTPGREMLRSVYGELCASLAAGRLFRA
jgi:gamma-glutamyl:cysteine ligase YbdK (ATP-grasp superfamily)